MAAFEVARDMAIELRNGGVHVMGGRIVAAKSRNFFHLGDPAVGFWVHPAHKFGKKVKELGLTLLQFVKQGVGRAAARGSKKDGGGERCAALGDAAVGHLQS